MMVADNHIYSLSGGIFNLLVGLDAAVQSDDQAETVVPGPVDALVGDPVALIVAIRNVEIDLRGVPSEE